uniref:NAD(P)-binding domain-containing protein n=1 Tax=Wuchereria bancrofti TaxID=6293 RepID=A0AAF5RY65_WUCBA
MFQKWYTLTHEIRETNVAAKVRQSSRYKFFKGTVRDIDLFLSLLRGYQIDTVIHFAGMTHVDKSYIDRVGSIEENIVSTTILLEAIALRYNSIKRFHSYKVPFVMVRINNVYGPNQTLSKLIPKFIWLAVEGKSYPLMGDGMHKRNWIYVDDCTNAIGRVCERGRIGEIYNIGIEFEITNYDVTVLIHQIVNELLKRNNTSP